MISAYTVVDGIGVRSAGTALGFAVWMSIGDGLLTFAAVYLLKRGQGVLLSRRYLKVGMIGSVMQTGAYWIILWAITTTPMAMVSALRETSVFVCCRYFHFFAPRRVWRVEVRFCWPGDVGIDRDPVRAVMCSRE